MDVRLSLDPGLTGMGLAVWEERTWADRRAVAPLCSQTFEPSGKMDWEQRGQDYAERLGRYLFTQSFEVVEAYCEFPIFYASSPGGHMAAATGDLLKLTYSVGCLAGAIAPGHFHAIKVPDWKGQLSKRLVEDRIRKLLGNEKCDELGITSHGWDAVGVGLYERGLF